MKKTTPRSDTKKRHHRMRRARFKRMRRQHTPNALSLVRFVAGPACYYLFTQQLWFYGTLLLTLGIITDYFDGYFARKYKVTTKTGTFLDPLADKVLVASVYAAFAQLGMFSWWVLGIIIVRDLVVTWLRSLLLARGTQLTTSWLAKCKTAVQFGAVYLFIVLTVWPVSHAAVYIQASAGLVVLLTVFSGLTYLRDL